jgi:hypothetical protein
MEKLGIKIQYGIKKLNVDILSYNEDSQMISYKVSGTPICQFDQHSRARVGIKFKDYKVSEDPVYVVYTQIYELMKKNEKFANKVFSTLSTLENYRKIETESTSISNPTLYNLMSRECSYIVEQSMTSLRGQMMRRLKFCEEEFIVGLHWLLKDKMINMGIESAKSFVPGCDLIKKCDYAAADYLSNAFGCLFAGCGRFPSHTDFASFNQSCTTPELIKEQLGIDCVRSSYEIENNLRLEKITEKL